MFNTILVPDWTATPELEEIIARRESEYIGPVFGYPIVFNEAHGYSFHLDCRVETMPESLREIPMRAVHMVKHNSPVTKAVDGKYHDGDITARVDTFVGSQTISVSGTNGTTLEELNAWFDDLMAGLKAEKNISPTAYPDAPRANPARDIPLVSRLRGPDGTQVAHLDGYIDSDGSAVPPESILVDRSVKEL